MEGSLSMHQFVPQVNVSGGEKQQAASWLETVGLSGTISLILVIDHV